MKFLSASTHHSFTHFFSAVVYIYLLYFNAAIDSPQKQGSWFGIVINEWSYSQSTLQASRAQPHLIHFFLIGGVFLSSIIFFLYLPTLVDNGVCSVLLQWKQRIFGFGVYCVKERTVKKSAENGETLIVWLLMTSCMLFVASNCTYTYFFSLLTLNTWHT